MLPIRTSRKLPDEPAFTHPPQWIHQAGQWLFSSREAKKRAVLRMLDRLPPARKKSA